MKKKVCILLTGIMVIASACGSSGSSGSNSESSTQEKAETGEVVEENDDSEAEESSGDEAEMVDETSEGEGADSEVTEESETDKAANAGLSGAENTAPLYITVNDGDSDSEEKDGEYISLFDGTDEELLIAPGFEDEYPELEAALWDLYEKNHSDFQKSAEELKAESREQFNDDYYIAPYADNRNIDVVRADDKVLSFYQYFYTYLGGAHGGYGIKPYTFDITTGERINLSDVLKIEKEELDTILYDKILNYKEQFSEEGYLDSFGKLKDTLAGYSLGNGENAIDEDISDEDTSDEDVSAENSNLSYTWFLGNDGLHVYFEIYSIAAYAEGATEITIGYDEMPEIFNEEFIPQGTAFISNMGWPYGVKLDIDGDGTEETMNFEYTYTNDDYENPSGFTIDIDGVKAECGSESFYADPEYVKIYHLRTEDNRNYIYVRTGGMSDYWDWQVFDVNNDSVKYVGEAGFTEPYVETKDQLGGTYCKTDVNNMIFGERTDCFGTIIGYTTWHVGDDGMPEVNDERRTLDYYGDGAVSKAELTVDVVDEDGNILEENVVIPAGETFIPVTSDFKTYLDAKLSDGRFVRITYTDIEGYPATIDGTSIDDLFDNIMYAG